MLNSLKSSLAGSSANSADSYKAQLARTTAAYAEQSDQIKNLQRELQFVHDSLRTKDATIQQLRAQINKLTDKLGTSNETAENDSNEPTASNGPSTPIRRHAAATLTPQEGTPPLPPLLASTTVAPFQRDSPYAAAQLLHADKRTASLCEYLSGVIALAKALDSSASATAAAGAKLGVVLQGIALQPSCAVGGGGEAVVDAWMTVGRVLQESTELFSTAASGVQHALGSSLEAELLSLAERTRAAKKAHDTAADEAEDALSRLMTLRRGASAGDVLSRAREAVSAATKSELARFDAVASLNTLEAKRRVILLDRASACSHALAALHRHLVQVVSPIESECVQWQDTVACAKAALPARDGLWRQVRDSLETNLVRATAAPGALSPAPKGYPGMRGGHAPGSSAAGSEGSAPSSGGGSAGTADIDSTGAIMLQMLRQAASPLDRIGEATKKACIALGEKLVALEDSESSSGAGSSIGHAPVVSPAESTVQPGADNHTPGGADRVLAGSPGSILISGWLYSNRRVEGDELTSPSSTMGMGMGSAGSTAAKRSGAAQSTGSTIMNTVFGGWTRRWFFIRNGRLYCLHSSAGSSSSTSALAPVQVIGDLAVCNVREGTDEAADAVFGGASGAIGIVSVAHGNDRAGDEGSSASSSRGGGVDSLPVSYAIAHAFEIRMPSKVLVFAAPTLAARKEWVRVLRDAAEAALTTARPTGSGGSAQAGGIGRARPAQEVDVSGFTAEDVEALKGRLAACTHTADDMDAALCLVRHRSRTCVDCGSAHPEWASLNLGAVMCLECSGVHRSLGVHISKVRSLILDSWEPGPLLVMLCLDNSTVNSIYMGVAGVIPPIPQGAARAEREGIIRSKYEAKVGVPEGTVGLGKALGAAVLSGDVIGMFRCLAQGAGQDLLSFTPGRPPTTALHLACEASATLAAVYMLIQTSGWEGEGRDSEGRSPWDCYLSACVVGTGVDTKTSSRPTGEAFRAQLVTALLPKRKRAAALATSDAILAAVASHDTASAMELLQTAVLQAKEEQVAPAMTENGKPASGRGKTDAVASTKSGAGVVQMNKFGEEGKGGSLESGDEEEGEGLLG